MSPHIDRQPGESKPVGTEPFIAYVKSFGPPLQVVQLPIGATLMFVADPKTPPMQQARWELTKVEKNKISFKCACGKLNCTRTMDLNRKISGNHPYTETRG